MNELKRILSFTRRAVDDFEMIDDGDKIAVGVSGGKDSLTLLVALASLRRFYPKRFDLVAITVDRNETMHGNRTAPVELASRRNKRNGQRKQKRW